MARPASGLYATGIGTRELQALDAIRERPGLTTRQLAEVMLDLRREQAVTSLAVGARLARVLEIVDRHHVAHRMARCL